MLSFFKKLFCRKSPRSASNVIARNRLTVVLVQDRAGLTSKELDQFRAELISVIEKYFVIDVSGFDIDYKRQADCTVLSISSPVLIKRFSDKVQPQTSKEADSLKLEVEVIKSNDSQKVAAGINERDNSTLSNLEQSFANDPKNN
ncbi:MAG: cell division topological specificity factor MinE [Deltaproteobacteria bacterium]|nr:cell division topological specificity factor MinE [Deltaproteobacteria bacterium]